MEKIAFSIETENFDGEMNFLNPDKKIYFQTLFSTIASCIF